MSARFFYALLPAQSRRKKNVEASVMSYIRSPGITFCFGHIREQRIRLASRPAASVCKACPRDKNRRYNWGRLSSFGYLYKWVSFVLWGGSHDRPKVSNFTIFEYSNIAELKEKIFTFLGAENNVIIGLQINIS